MNGAITCNNTLSGVISPTASMTGTLSAGTTLSGTLTIPQKIGPDVYRGPYIATASAETQVLQTKDLLLSGNITINPIPSNYGLITWDGATLTVS